MDTKISALAALTDIAPTDEFVIVDKSDTSMAGSGTDKKVTLADIKRIPLFAPQGFLINGKISVTDAAGITVAIKTLAGTDPSATDPVYVRIGDTVRTISAALSVSIADGTNWGNAGSTELATQEIDWFVYLQWEAAASAVVIGFSRFPGAAIVGDFSSTATNEKAILSSMGAYVTTDTVELIGRFAATLSSGAGYTWSVPTYTVKNLIQRPIYETRWLVYVTSATASAGTWSSAAGQNFMYKVTYNTVDFTGYNSGTTSSTPQALRCSLPFTSAAAGAFYMASGYTTDNGVAQAGSAEISGGNAYVTCYQYDFGNYTATTAQVARVAGTYFI